MSRAGFAHASEGGAADFGVVAPRRGQAGLGGTRRDDRSVSTYDVKHSFAATFLYELPLGAGRRFLSSAPAVVDAALGGWNLSGIVRVVGGWPFQAVLDDTNRLSGDSEVVRPNLVPGVPIKNPRYDRRCPIGSTCEPYFNPSAFMRPPKGQLGNAPRTFDNARTPAREYFDLSVLKDFRVFGKDSKRYLQFRVDFVDAFNHPNFNTNPNGSHALFGAPSESAISTADYNSWASANSRPRTDAADAAARAQAATLLTQINNRLNSARSNPGNPNSVLPANFFSTPVPAGFALASPNQFDITTFDGLKLFRLRQAYLSGFGGVGNNGERQRVIQFALKLYF